MSAGKTKASFIEPMLLLRTEMLPDSSLWLYQLKLDGYRAIAFRSGNVVSLRSRNDNDFALRYPAIAEALSGLPDDTVIDGEIVSLDESGRPSFGSLQNYGSSSGPLYYYVFDVLMLGGRSVMAETLDDRQQILETKILNGLRDPVRHAITLDASLPDLIDAVKSQGLEGLVAKRRDSIYEPGQRSGAWRKMRVSSGQEFVIGGYTVGGRTFDAIVVGYYQGRDLIYTARTRNGFTPALRDSLMTKFRGLEIADCPFVNLPEAKSGRWGQGLTSVKMRDCRWLRPILVAQLEFVEWTGDNHLRHSRFIGLREDRKARDVVRES